MATTLASTATTTTTTTTTQATKKSAGRGTMSLATTSTKNRFYEVIDDKVLFNRLMMYSASNFCPEIALFLEEYQQLKAKVVAFYNMGEPGFDHPELDIDIDSSKGLNNNYQANSKPKQPAESSGKDKQSKGGLFGFGSKKSTSNNNNNIDKNAFPPKVTITSETNTWDLESTPPFSSARVTILQTLINSPAGRRGLTTNTITTTNNNNKQVTKTAVDPNHTNVPSFKVVPFALRSQFYGFYRIFIAEGGTLQINIEGRKMDRITKLIESYHYTVDMLDEVHGEVLQMLYQNIYRKFVRSFSFNFSQPSPNDLHPAPTINSATTAEDGGPIGDN